MLERLELELAQRLSELELAQTTAEGLQEEYRRECIKQGTRAWSAHGPDSELAALARDVDRAVRLTRILEIDVERLETAVRETKKSQRAIQECAERQREEELREKAKAQVQERSRKRLPRWGESLEEKFLKYGRWLP